MPSRVGKKEAAGSTPALATVNESGLSRAIASPWAILLVFPIIVFSVGAFLTVTGHAALRDSNTEMAKERLGDQALLVAEHMNSALGAAEPMLQQLQAAVLATNADAPAEELGPIFRDVMRGRGGVSYVSASFPDGTFQGAFLDEDRQIRFQISRLVGDVTEKRVYDYSDQRQLRQRKSERSDYDPRNRAFYQLATKERRPVWTDPYAFAGTNYTGITRTVPVYGTDENLHAVLTVDFDVASLSTLLERQQLNATRALLIGKNGVLLADPRAKETIEKLRRPGEVLHFADLKDPVLDLFFKEAERGQEVGVSHIDAPDGRYLVAVAPVGHDPALGWRVAYLAPESSFLASLYSYSRKSWVIGGTALVLALLLSIGFARLVVRVRKEAADARAVARKAHERARELGSYRLLECLGKGGMGEVWRGEHRLLARQAAIKLIRNDEGEAPKPEAVERFRREAQSLAGLQSDNTIELYDYGVTEDGTLFYVMELLDGLDLDTLVQELGPQPPARVVHLLIQACRSLAEAHEHGLVHRDIKPANIFVCRRADDLDLIKVLDFGLVRAVDANPPSGKSPETQASTTLEELRVRQDADVRGEADDSLTGSLSGPKLTRADHLMGTPEFMAPEQATGGDVDARADIYALGAVAFWLLSGKPVFQKQNVVQLIVAHMTETPPDVAESCPEPLPEGLAALVTQCLAKGPGERPENAREMVSRLRALRFTPDEAWTTEKMEAWWAQYRPAQTTVSQASVGESPTVAIDLKLQVALQSVPPARPDSA